MMEQKFIDRIETLRHHTYSRIQELQRNLCPMVKRDIYMNYQFEYWYDGYKYNLWEDDTHIYAVKEIPYCYDNDLKNTVFQGNLKDLVDEDKVWPFLLFINGEVIPWSDITIIHDYDYSYMRIDNYGPDYSFYTDMIVFPIGSKQIRYGEDSDILVNVDERKGFYFDENRKRISNLDFTDILVRLEILDNDIYYKEIDLANISTDILTFEDLPKGFIPSLDNILLFDTNGRFIHSHPEEYFSDIFNGALGKFRIDNIEDAGIAILLYNTSHTKSFASLYDRLEDLDIDKISDLFNSVEQGSDDWNNVVSKLIEKFDFDHEFGVDYETNLNNAASYISEYDYRLWKDSFLDDEPVKSFIYKGSDYKNLADSKGYIRLSRKHADPIQDVAMVFVNSKLYEYSIDISYTNNTINIPIFGIMDEDHVELILFTKCNNLVLDIKVPDADTEVYIHPEYNLDDTYIMSEDCPDSEYTVPESVEHRRQYITEYTYEAVEGKDGYYKITFENEYYYGKDLKVVPKRQFRHYRFKQRDGQFKIILPTQFNYCHDPNRYLIFINGKKIDRTEYTVTIMNKYRPFDKLVLYLSTILDEGDYVDIFYIPMILKESYRLDSIEKDGLLKLTETTEYPVKYPFSKYTTMIFINGYKVNPLEIKDVDMNQLLINVDKYVRDEDGNKINNYGYWETVPYAIESIYNVTVMEYLEGNEELKEFLLPDNYDNWRHYIENLQETNGLEAIFGNRYEIEDSDIEENYKVYFGGLRSILYDIIIDYYLVRNEANTGEAFVYDFERAEWDPYSRYSGDEDLDSVDNVKLITVFEIHDKLLDYIPTTENIADSSNVLEGMQFYPADNGGL
jgi:hypothetical protein